MSHHENLNVQYVENNRQIAKRVLIFLEDRRVLTERIHIENFEECRRSAHDIRGLLQNELIAISGKGPLSVDLSDMQKACRNFVSAAGTNSVNFRRDGSLFNGHMTSLREIFAQRIRHIAEVFDESPGPQLQELLNSVSARDSATNGWTAPGS